jgi:Domain of unknown function (DUF5063)
MTRDIHSIISNLESFLQWAESNSHDMGVCRQYLLQLMMDIPVMVDALTDDFSDAEFECRSFEEWKSDFHRFRDLPVQYYWVVLDPLEIDSEDTGLGDLHDDMADIYGEIWHGWQAHLNGDDIYALDHWVSSYFDHWGNHAASALHIIDQYYRDASKP